MMIGDESEKGDMPDFSGVTGGASSTAPAKSPEVEIYEVVKGDSLSKIAKKKYGDARDWKLIYEANRELIKNPDVIQIGWKLKIPARASA